MHTKWIQYYYKGGTKTEGGRQTKKEETPVGTIRYTRRKKKKNRYQKKEKVWQNRVPRRR